ncbi:hypothetical protein BJI47_17730 [Rhodococcus sp. 1168]|nr:hypothetical protein [Rhodococcus sp. 1168]ORI21258.1 hypothetical protein BJI47_17730 [Rhodococcus sp. 1168]
MLLALRDGLRSGDVWVPDSRRYAGCPVAVPIDRWGQMSLPADAMSPAAIADIVDAYRRGAAPLRSPVRRKPRDRTDDAHAPHHLR